MDNTIRIWSVLSTSYRGAGKGNGNGSNNGKGIMYNRLEYEIK